MLLGQQGWNLEGLEIKIKKSASNKLIFATKYRYTQIGLNNNVGDVRGYEPDWIQNKEKTKICIRQIHL